MSDTATDDTIVRFMSDAVDQASNAATVDTVATNMEIDDADVPLMTSYAQRQEFLRMQNWVTNEIGIPRLRIAELLRRVSALELLNRQRERERERERESHLGQGKGKDKGNGKGKGILSVGLAVDNPWYRYQLNRQNSWS